MTQEVAFTIKYNKATDDYEGKYKDILEMWRKKKCVIMYHEMHTDKPIYHIHGLMSCSKRIYFRTLMKQGYHLKFEVIYNHEGWRKYCEKCKVKFLPCLFTNYEVKKTCSTTGDEKQTNGSDEEIENPVPTRRIIPFNI